MAASRDLRVDVLRGVALLSMFIAHTAPPGPWEPATYLTNYLTAALFAALVGVGLHLSWQRHGPGPRYWIGAFVRGLALIVLGQVVAGFGAQIVEVLTYLGALTWVMALLAWVPTWAAGLGCLGMAIASPILREAYADGGLVSGPLEIAGIDVWQVLLTGPTYRVSALLAWALLGVFVFTTLRSVSRGDMAGVAGFAALACLGMWALRSWAGVDLEPYDGMTPSILFNGFAVVLAWSVTWLIADAVGESAQSWLAGPGQMTLTLYVAHAAWLAYDVKVLADGARGDNTWTNLLVLIAGSLILATAWRALVRVHPWRRGPIEGALDGIVDGLSPGGARSSRAR